MIKVNEEYDEIYYHEKGGIEFNDINLCSKTKIRIDNDTIDWTELNISNKELQNIITILFTFYRQYHFTFMEINPLILDDNNRYIPLDFAVKYDTTSYYKWNDFGLQILKENETELDMLPIELAIKNLDESSGASFKFKVINPNGSICLLVAGGGASVLYTDIIINRKLKDELINYGEYSGNPSSKHVYQYCCHVFDTMLQSKTTNQMYLFIGGGISNFTDIEVTFEGICKAITKFNQSIREREIKIYVRRGGINYKRALQLIEWTCDNYNIDCTCYDPSEHITKFIKDLFPIDDVNNNNNDDTLEQLPFELEERIDNLISTIKHKTIYNPNSKIVILNYKPHIVQRILDYDYLCNKNTPSVVGIVHPQKGNTMFPIFWGNKEILLPVYSNLDTVIEKHPNVEVVINYYSFRSAYQSTLSALEYDNIKTVAVIAEGIAERESRLLRLRSNQLGKTIIGPATVGSLLVNGLRIGSTCGSINNIKSLKLYRQGNVSLVTRSGGLLNEMCNIISQYSNGIKEAVSIGGDRYPSSTFIDHILRFNNDNDVKLICLLGEVGGILELEVATAYKKGLIKKPIIAYCMGTSASEFNEDIQFGHAGSVATNYYETADYKNSYMRQCNIHVPDTFENIEELIKTVSNDLSIKPIKDNIKLRDIPQDYNTLAKSNKVRKHSSFFSSISNETKDVLEYNHVPVTNIINNNHHIGKTIGHLLFRKNIPDYLAGFIELIISLVADHGIAVSSAHNTAIATRSGASISSSVASGMLTINEKHGGAIHNSADTFYKAKYIEKLTPSQFVSSMKKANKYIPGIGHKYKNSTTRKDLRIQSLLKYINGHFPFKGLVSYALQVETITLRKKDNLILNVDGVIGTAIISAFIHEYNTYDVLELLRLGGLNALFIIPRTIGLCATYIDQIRLGQGLYRHNLNDISYI
jgi:ATP citrate (pro-S)-lyase